MEKTLSFEELYFDFVVENPLIPVGEEIQKLEKELYRKFIKPLVEQNSKQGLELEAYIGKNRVGAVDDLWIIRDAFKISDDLSDEEALAEYIRIRNTPPEPEVDANERIAAALEFLSLMSL